MNRWPDQATRAFDEWDRERKTKRYRYWKMLRSAKDEFIKLTQQDAEESNTDSGAFFYYLKQTYGLQIETVDGNIGAEYAVVDEKKYLLFLMKFGS
jgi:hypothetical protein